MRRQFLVTLAAGTAALSFAAPAFAQDVEEAPFSGIYVGGTIGFDAQPNDVGERVLFDRNLDGNFNDTVLNGLGQNAFAPSVAQPGAGFCNGRAISTGSNSGCRNDKDNISYSARIGFDKQFGNIVFGAVGEFGKSQIRDSVTGFSTTPANYVLTREIDYNANARLRLGYAANTTLFYATGGGAYAKLDRSYSSTNVTNPAAFTGDNDVWGYVAGGGIEQKLGRNFSIGLEYLYTQYNDDDSTVRLTGPAGTPFTNATNGGSAAGTDFIRSDDKFRFHSVRATAQFRF